MPACRRADADQAHAVDGIEVAEERCPGSFRERRAAIVADLDSLRGGRVHLIGPVPVCGRIGHLQPGPDGPWPRRRWNGGDPSAVDTETVDMTDSRVGAD